MKLSVKLPMVDPNMLIPSSSMSGTSMSSKTLGRDFVDMESLDKVPEVRSL